MGNSRHIDTRAEIFQAFLVFLVGSALTGLAIAGVFILNPDLSERIYYGSNMEPDLNYSGDSIKFKEAYFTGDVGLNSMFRDTDSEFGYCMRVVDGRVEEMLYPESFGEITETSISFACQDERGVNGIFHTHPNFWSIPELSDVDRSTLLEDDDIIYSCVMSGVVTDNEYNRPLDFNCFKQVDDHVERMEVTVAEGDAW